MGGQRLRVFVACGTGRRFARLLRAVTPMASNPNIELFVQRGEAANDFDHLPGAASLPRADFAERLSWANAVITHGGAGALHEALAAGHRPLVMARLAAFGEHVNDHQEELVGALARRGLVVPLVEPLTVTDLTEVSHARGASHSTSRPAELIDAVREAIEAESTVDQVPFAAARTMATRLVVLAKAWSLRQRSR